MTSNFTSQEDDEDLAIVLREAREIQRVSVADLAYSDNHLATGLAAERYSRPNTRTPQQLIAHLRKAPVELPEGPAADDS